MRNKPPARAVSPLFVFAVKEEARPFQRLAGQRSEMQVLVTGIGARNAEREIRGALAARQPGLVLTCGFAGGLNPELTAGTVIFSADDNFSLSSNLLVAGARPARFHCADEVAVTTEEKRALRLNTGADAVEMESGIVRAICREHGIPSATVRVISDAACEDLPVDFNQLMDSDQHLSYGKLAVALLKSPRKIGALLRLQGQTRVAAEKLAGVLARVISDRTPDRS